MPALSPAGSIFIYFQYKERDTSSLQSNPSGAQSGPEGLECLDILAAIWDSVVPALT